MSTTKEPLAIQLELINTSASRWGYVLAVLISGRSDRLGVYWPDENRLVLTPGYSPTPEELVLAGQAIMESPHSPKATP